MVRRIVSYLMIVSILAISILMVRPPEMKAQSGSGSTSIYSTIFINRPATNSPSTYPYHSAPFSNIGQVGNQVFIRSHTSTGASCTTGGISAGLEFSYDGNNWVEFGSPTISGVAVNLDGVTGQVYFGAGLFPRIRFTIQTIDLASPNCFLDAYYTGSSNTVSLQSPTVFSGTRVNSLPNAVIPNQLMGVTANNTSLPLYTCKIRSAGGPVSAGTIRLIDDGPVFATNYICFVYVTTSATAATVQLTSGGPNSQNCSANSSILSGPMNLSSASPLILGGALGIIGEGNGNFGLCMVVTGGPVSYMVGVGVR